MFNVSAGASHISVHYSFVSDSTSKSSRWEDSLKSRKPTRTGQAPSCAFPTVPSLQSKPRLIIQTPCHLVITLRCYPQKKRKKKIDKVLERSVILASKAPCNIMLTDVRHGQHQATAEAVAGLLDTSTHRWFSTKNNSGLYYAKIEKSILNKDTTHAPSYQHKY